MQILCFTLLIIEVRCYLLYYKSGIRQVAVSCTTDLNLFIQLILIIGVSLLCVLNGIRARNLPACYNETQFISFAMMTSSLSLLILFPLYYSAANYQSKSIILSLCLMLGNTAILLIIFGYKLYVIYFVPEKNTTNYFRKQMNVYSLEKTDNEIQKKTSKSSKRSIRISIKN